MNVENKIINSLNTNLSPDKLYVVNESHMHNVPADAETHFKVTIISHVFTTLKDIQRHRLIHKTLGDLMNKIHAITIIAHTPNEWKKTDSPIQSPNCQKKRT